MKLTFLMFGLFLLPPASIAEPCDYDFPELDSFRLERALQHIEYKNVRMKPGYTLTVGESLYVLVRMPFADLTTGERYAITYPVEIYETPQGKMIHPSITITENRFGGESCSDVAVGESPSPVHKISAQQQASVSIGYVNGKRMLRNSRMYQSYLSFRTASTAVSVHLFSRESVQIGCEKLKDELASGEKTGDWDCPQSIDENDHDLVDNVNWSVFSDPGTEQLKGLDRLVDHVYVERLN